MSLLVAAALAAGSFVVGRWVMRTGDARGGASGAKESSRGDEREGERSNGEAGRPGRPQPASAHARELFAEFPCTLGDVILRTGGEEAWLAGALVFSEEVPVAALFVAPDAGGDRAIFVRPRPAPSLAWLEQVPPEALSLGAEPPNALEHEGLWFERLRRLPVRAERVGSGAPDVGEQVILAEYGASGTERLVVVAAPGVARAWRGTALEPPLYEVLASGKSTLDQDG